MHQRLIPVESPARGRCPRRGLLGLTVCLAIVGCSDPTGVDHDLERDLDRLIQTEHLFYELRSDSEGLSVDIPYKFENRTGAAVYLVNCNGAFSLLLERWVGDRWVTAWGPILPACLSPPIVIDDGAVFADTLRVWGATPGSNTFPQFDVANPSGTYRIVWVDALSSFQSELPFGAQIAFDFRVSNRFALEKR